MFGALFGKILQRVPTLGVWAACLCWWSRPEAHTDESPSLEAEIHVMFYSAYKWLLTPKLCKTDAADISKINLCALMATAACDSGDVLYSDLLHIILIISILLLQQVSLLEYNFLIFIEKLWTGLNILIFSLILHYFQLNSEFLLSQ